MNNFGSVNTQNRNKNQKSGNIQNRQKIQNQMKIQNRQLNQISVNKQNGPKMPVPVNRKNDLNRPRPVNNQNNKNRQQIQKQQVQNRQIQNQQNQPQAPKRKMKFYYDYSLLAAVVLLATFGLLMVYSSSQYVAMVNKGDPDYYFKRQLIIFAACLIGCIVYSKIFRRRFSYKILKPMAIPIFAVACLVQFMTLIMGLSSHGKTRWISIAGVSFQPAELTKIAIIIFMASAIAKLGYKINKPKNIAILCGVVILPILAITSENLSSGIITAGIVFVMLFVACRQWKAFIAVASLGLAAVLGLKPIVHSLIIRFNLPRPDHYQLRRIFGWAAPDLFPTDAYQTMQGLYAIGSGGITGQGLGESIQKFGKLPEAHNDMIFPIIIEELGLIGAMAIVFLFLFLIYRLAQIASNSNDLFGSMICVGIIAHISIQVILNIAVVTGVIPNTGVTLPFISYGGSAILCTMAEITLALNISNCIRLE